LQRALVNEAVLCGAQKVPELLTARDVLRFATLEGARCLHLDSKTGTLTPGKQADIIMLNAEALNVTPLNHAAGAVVSLMDRSNVDTVLVAGKVRKWRGALLDVDLPKVRRELRESRDYLFHEAGVEQNLFR
jgi:5-methylthioadenosine/S-adenosylhomocysteine deaminase